MMERALISGARCGAVLSPGSGRLRPVAGLAVVIASLLLAARLASAAQLFTEIDPGVAQPPFPCVAWGDYDGDGDLDLLVAGLGSHDIAFANLYRNTGGTFANSGAVLLGLSRASAAWGDFDGDGDLDLAMTGLTTAGVPTTRVYRNDGGTFTALAGSFLGVLAGNIAWGDMDGDGDLDLIVTGVTSTSPQVGVGATRLYRNDAGTFVQVTHPFPNCYLGSVAWGDYDNDGRLDVIITGTSETGGLFAGVWHNDGGGAFSDAGANLPGDDLGYAVWGDYDGDGDLDLLFGGNSNDGFISRIYRNDGGSFTDIQAGLLPVLWAAAQWGDFDDDGDLDVMLMGYDPVAQVPRSILYRNDAGTFVDSGQLFHNLYLGTASAIDYDNDGDLDVLLAGNSAGLDVLRLFRNDGIVGNTAPTAPGNLTATPSGTTVNLSWTAASDDHTPASGLSYNLRVGTTPGGCQVVSPHAAAGGYRRLPALGNAQSDLSATLVDLKPDSTYYWSVQAVDGAFVGGPFAAEGSFTVRVAGVGDPGLGTVVTMQAGPNPFREGTVVRVAGSAEALRVMVFDAAGRRVRTLYEGSIGGGHLALRWDGRDGLGRRLPTGIYLVRLERASVGALGRPVVLAKLE